MDHPKVKTVLRNGEECRINEDDFNPDTDQEIEKSTAAKKAPAKKKAAKKKGKK